MVDLALLGAVLAAALGYAEGGQVISWALTLAAPFLVLPMVLMVRQHGLSGSFSAWLSFGYLGVVSQFLGFFAWYRGLALGGMARVSQLQLLQPFLTIVASGLLLGEQITLTTFGVALVVVATVALGRKAPVVGPATGPAGSPARTDSPPPGPAVAARLAPVCIDEGYRGGSVRVPPAPGRRVARRSRSCGIR